MKRGLICSLVLSFIISTNTWGQSNALRQSFNELNTFLKEYKINSAMVGFHAETKNMKASFDYPYLTISFTDVPEEGYDRSVAKGDQRIRTNLKETTISVKNTSYTFTPSYSLVFYNPNGIETTVQGRKDLVESYSFSGSELTLKKAAELLNVVKEKILAEGYTGKLGASATTSANKNNAGTTASQSGAPLTKKYNHVRYSISYPENWTSMNNVQGADVYIGANDGSIAFTVLSFQTPYSLDEVMAEANSQAALAGWKKTNTSTTLCGVKCYKSTITFTSNGMSVKQIQYTLKKNGFVYNLNFGNDATKVNANTSLISSIANSFIIK